MTRRDLRNFLHQVEATGELRRIGVEVSAELEIAAITDRVCKSPELNMALLFTRVCGSPYMVATNLFGSDSRLALALGRGKLADLTPWFDAILAGVPGRSSLEKLDALVASPLWQWREPSAGDAPPAGLQERGVDLGLLPILKSLPGDGLPDHGGRFMTLPLVITAPPGGGTANCGMYRCGIAHPDLLAIKWSGTSGAALHAAAWEELGEPMPVTVVLGGPPSLTFAATLPLPVAVDEFGFAGLLSGEPIRLYRCGNGLPAPADAELVVEGYLHPGETIGSGAFGNHTGYYTPSAGGAGVRVTSIRHRSDMICPATVVGRPPMEDCWFGRGWERLLLPLLKVDFPDVTGLRMPFAGIFHGGAVISGRTVAGRGEDLLHRIRTTPWFAGSRLIVLVDEEQDPADEAGVCWRIMNNVTWSEDLLVEGDTLTLDATRKSRERRVPVVPDPDVALLVERRWREYGFTH